MGILELPGFTWFVSHVRCSNGQNIGGKIGAILGAGVGGMRTKRVKAAAQMLPDAAPPVPMKAQRPKQRGQPNPFASDLGNLVLSRQPSPQKFQNCFRRQLAIEIKSFPREMKGNQTVAVCKDL
jgi:hypothetical protein